jgi:hypothetical protein
MSCTLAESTRMMPDMPPVSLKIIPFRVINSREFIRNLRLQADIAVQHREFSIVINITLDKSLIFVYSAFL